MAKTIPLNYLGQQWFETGKLQLVECICAGASANFQLKLNLKLAEMYREKQKRVAAFNLNDKSMAPLKDLSFFDSGEAGFLSNINKQTQKIVQWEIDRLLDLGAETDLIDALTDIQKKVAICREGEAVLRMGGHNGWHFMTGRWMMYDEHILTDNMFDSMRQAAQRTSKYIGLQFPKTRKITDAGLPLGFVKIEL